MNQLHHSSGLPGKATWRGLSGCLVTGALVIAAAVWIAAHVRRSMQQKEQRLRTEFLDPWFQAVRGDTLESAIPFLTTSAYQQRNAAAAVAATYRVAVRQFGAPQEVVLERATGQTVVGSGHRVERAVTRWRWARGAEVALTFELEDVPGSGYRLDAARLSSRGHIRPQDTPDGPW